MNSVELSSNAERVIANSIEIEIVRGVVGFEEWFVVTLTLCWIVKLKFRS